MTLPTRDANPVLSAADRCHRAREDPSEYAESYRQTFTVSLSRDVLDGVPVTYVEVDTGIVTDKTLFAQGEEACNAAHSAYVTRLFGPHRWVKLHVTAERIMKAIPYSVEATLVLKERSECEETDVVPNSTLARSQGRSCHAIFDARNAAVWIDCNDPSRAGEVSLDAFTLTTKACEAIRSRERITRGWQTLQ